MDQFNEDLIFHDHPFMEVDNLVAKFGEIEQTAEIEGVIIGTCHPANIPTITIDANAWAEMTDTSRKIVMYHELGHCVLFRPHVEKPKISIMNPYILGDDFYESNEEALLSELFDSEEYNELGSRATSCARHRHYR